ncbi:hypothetical protein QC999_gp63 [Microbacterium phage Cressida]|uniref:Uncharacterized protein n=2 Tax=Mementomorivirus TaxID=2733194 RepID=A0A514DI76_9CAUD|nr:hypothetical protein QC999_gp63 [Microbacterium phage Cressida]YP_010750954.1 hypothetical protein QDA00_gp66 [Microbacterium phage Matzah]QDH93287.1 hypothetical protein PBI_CRESSIDA_45 [Microbacterium phage Cressida]QHB37037.1 hypothetical protein SEA_MATZAH_44 [Microbacterium phage Matzah]
MTEERCGTCASHGVVSRQIAREVRPGVYVHEQKDVPCPTCRTPEWLERIKAA